MKKDSKIYVAGHRGLVGAALVKKLTNEGYTNIVTRTSQELDLRKQKEVQSFFESEMPEYVFLTAAKAGGVLALDTYKADAIYDNLMIQSNVIYESWNCRVKKLMFIASNCIYPKLAVEPFKEEYLMAGKLEPTTEHYAVAKIAGIKMCEAYREQYGCNFISVVPVNLFGDNEKYDPEKSHVMISLINKIHNAKKNNSPSVEIWGTGKAMREFMYVDDMVDACLFLMLKYNDREPINIGNTYNASIHGIADLIAKIAGYNGEIIFNSNKPDGTLSKKLDTTKIDNLGWKGAIPIREGIERVLKSLE